jgi:hypothetical protein
MAPGDVNRLRDFILLDYSLTATAAMSKGDIVTLKSGRKWQSGDVGPYGVATQAISNGAEMKGKVLRHGVVAMLVDSAVAAHTYVKPATATKVHTGVTAITDCLGESMEDASADGDEIDVELE